MKYVNIYNGVIREKGDQVRSKDIGNPAKNHSTSEPIPGGWREVSLIGWPILRSDTMHADFRRPL